MWAFQNPAKILFGEGVLHQIPKALAGRRYLLVTYGEPEFTELAEQISREAGAPLDIVDAVKPNPDFLDLHPLSAELRAAGHESEAIVALGGGSVIDVAKALSASPLSFDVVERHLTQSPCPERFKCVPIIAIPTTAGTGSEVTSWATIWDSEAGKKYSLADPRLVPETVLIDPSITLGLPRELTISTALDALSHSLESIWNKNANPISANFAVEAAREIIEVLPSLTGDLRSGDLRSRMAKAALLAGLAFSNTKTALAHSLSYPITLEYGIRHGVACSFTLPIIMASIIGQDETCDAVLERIFGPDLEAGAERLATFLRDLDIGVTAADHGIDRSAFRDLIESAFEGERGRNFIGEKPRVLAAEAHFASAFEKAS